MFHGVLSIRLQEPATVYRIGGMLSGKNTVACLWTLLGRVKVCCGRRYG